MNIYTPLDPMIPWVIQAAILVGGLMCLAGVMVRRKIAATGGGVIPDEGISLRNVLEGKKITRLELARVVRDRHHDAVTLRLWATGRDYTVSDDDGQVAASQGTHPGFAQDIYLQQRVVVEHPDRVHLAVLKFFDCVAHLLDGGFIADLSRH